MHTVKVDSAGRLKLPAEFLEYFAGLKHTRFFLTTLDTTLGLLYPVSVWRATEKFLEEYSEDPESADAVRFNAAAYGGESVLDGNGRVLIPAEMRQALGIENAPVRLKAVGQHVEILSEQLYESFKEKGKKVTAADIAKLRKAGLPK